MPPSFHSSGDIAPVVATESTLKGGMIAMKAQLIVVQGKSEGRTIPLSGRVFKIGRGETCHLRPNSERVSREHAEFTMMGEVVMIRDLGSRNGTLVNGKALTQPAVLSNGDRVQVGPLTFTVSFLDVPGAEVPSAVAPEAGTPSRLDPSRGFSEPWLEAENAGASAGARGCETILIPAFFEPSTPRPIASADDADDDEYERHPVADGDTVLDCPTTDLVPPPSTSGPAPDKKSKIEAAGKKSNDTAAEILRKMMELRPVSK